MALITCPECGKEVSDQANSCPNCGFPIKQHFDDLKVALSKSYCLCCNKQNKIGSIYCEECGIRLDDYENIVKENNINNEPSKTYYTRQSYAKSAKDSGNKLNNSNITGKTYVKLGKVVLFTILGLLVFIAILGNSSSNSDYNKEEIKTDIYTDDKEENKNINETEADISLVEEQTSTDYFEQMKNLMGEDVANGLKDVLINQIGFSEIKNFSKMGDSFNYEFEADGHTVVATAMDDFYRVFIPHSGYVFYEDGKVVMSAEKFAGSTFDFLEKNKYHFIAKEIITQFLTDPKSANFPSDDYVSVQKQDNLIAVQGYVDADNAFGGTVRTEYVVQFYVLDMDNIIYEVQYINIEGETSGTYIEFE